MEDTVDLPVIDDTSSQAPSSDSLGKVSTVGTDYNGLCEKYAEEQVFGHSGIHPTAADAWNSYVNNGSAYEGTEGIQPGSLIYFNPDNSNGGYGHVGVYKGNGQFESATYDGVKTLNLDDWEKGTGQKVLGWVAPTSDSSSVVPLD